MTYLFLRILIITNIIFFISNNPLSKGFFLLIQTFILIFFINKLLNIYWISYLFYLIIIGGLIILLIYICSISSNELIISNWILIFILIFIINTFNFLFFPINYLINYINSYFTWSSNINLISINYSFILYNKLINFNYSVITIILITYLFLCLLVISTLINFFSSPFRSNN